MIGTIIAAWFDVRTRPLRTLASIAGMVAAITSVITIDAAGALSRRSQADYLALKFGRAATLELRPQGHGDAVSRESATVIPALLRQLGANLATPIKATSLVLLNGDQQTTAQGLVVGPSYASVRALDIINGSFPTHAFLERHAVLSERVVTGLGLQPSDVVGQTVRVVYAGSDANPDRRTASSVQVVVDGVMRVDPRASVPYDVLLTGNPDPQPDAWLVRVSPGDTSFLKAELATLSRDHPLVAAGLQVRRVDEDEVLAPLLDQQAATGQVIALVALAVGGLGLFGVGLAGVRERSREFGVRRALGAPRSAIFGAVLIETLLEVLASAVLAVALADLVVHLIPRQLVVALLPVPTTVTLPVASAAKGVISAAVVGVAAGLIPAVRAVRLSVKAAIAG